MLTKLLSFLIARAERRIGVGLDYARKIANTDLGLFRRYGRIFSFLDGNAHASAVLYHVARMRGAIALDCGTCIKAEINLARQAGLDSDLIDRVLSGDYAGLPKRSPRWPD